MNLDFDWRFQLGDTPQAAQEDYQDGAWRLLNVPHDWAAEEPLAADGPQGGAGGYAVGGVGWYRKTFEVPQAWLDQATHIEFDGIYMNSEVWLNGNKLGRRPYGYISFGYDLTGKLHAGRNVISIRVDNSKEPSARWYHPCGVYGHVNLVVTSPLRIAPDGVFVSTPEITGQKATVQVETLVKNELPETSEYQLETRLYDPEGQEIAFHQQSINNGKDRLVKQSLVAPAPKRWDVDTPQLYVAESSILQNGKVVDQLRTRFGIRTVRWDAKTGFWLNDKNIKLKGVCEHLEGGPVGGAWPDELIEWKLRLLKQMGCNAIRTAHNPQVPKFYDLCDEIGLLVMDEIFDGWKKKAEWDYGRQAFAKWWRRDLEGWIRRDRNHPCIICWSVGNETRGDVGKDIVAACHAIDPTRLVTSGHSGSQFMDVVGVNGHSERRHFFDEWKAQRPFVATEAPHTWQVRGYYRSQTWYRDGYPNKRQDPFEIPDLAPQEIFFDSWCAPEERSNRKQIFNSSYDNATVRINARQHWQKTRDLSWFSGFFRWTGFDYPGEATYVHGGWPFRAFMGGALDLAGFPKDLFYFYQSQWIDEPMIHILPHWTHPQLEAETAVPVWVYTNLEEVELWLNGKSLGRKRPGRQWDKMQCEWLVPWRPGKLQAVGYRNGREVKRAMQQTSGAPSRLGVQCDSDNLAADGRDCAQLTINFLDSAGAFYPYGENRVYFHCDGPVRLLALENGSPVDVEPTFGQTSRRGFYGRLRAFLQATRATGNVSVVVGAICGEKRQLTSNQVAIDCQRVSLRGTQTPNEWDVHYTLDDTKPTSTSPRYEKPFTVSPETTVRAAVFHQGKLLFEMQEKFGPQQGHHWGSAATEIVDTGGGEQAEDAKFQGATLRKEGKGYRGRGYVDFGGGKGYVEWYQENDGSPGPVKLVFRYAAQHAKGNRKMLLRINGREAATLEFPNTGSWNTTWRTLETVQTLQSGANQIRLQTADQSGVNLDELTIEPAE
ncbi:MAG: DUF4982 domain-containing protein [Pirellulales bacterium]|nr:DUF4982 domain-containing protein [Pirellulales bacterium]